MTADETRIKEAREAVEIADRSGDHADIEYSLSVLAIAAHDLFAAVDERDALRKRVDELERGEYICKKCGLRKDADKAEDADF